MAPDLDARMDRLSLDQGQDSHYQGHANGTLEVPTAQGVRKQRSQRFTVPTSLHSHSHSSPAPTVLPLPYQAPPPPVQAQSANPFHLADHAAHHAHHHPRSFFSPAPAPPPPHSPLDDPYAQYASYPAPPVPPTLAPDFLASPTGMSPYPGPAFRPPQPQSFAGAYHHHGAGVGAQAFHAPQMQQALSGGGGGGFAQHVQVPQVVADHDDEIIDTAIVIKNIPFACPKEQLLGIMSSLALPPPFAFNYHFAPEDPTSFRGLAFANYRTGEEAGVVRAAMDGLEIMGRKLRCEFKKALKPGEKEAIERTKALKRMRSAQLLAVGAAGGPDFASWNRREASAPGGFAGGGGGGWNAGLGVGVGGLMGGVGLDAGQDEYGRPLALGQATFGGVGVGAGAGTGAGAGVGAGARGNGVLAQAPTSFGQRDYVTAPMEPTYSSESASASASASVSPPSSDVGTSVSQRMERGAGSVDSESGTVATTASVGPAAAAGGKNDLDLNDPPTLELYSRVLLFQGDSLRDELAFSRSLSSQQRRTVHLIAKKLGLEHRSLGDGEARHVVVYKPGTAPPPGPRRPLRGSLSTAALRRVVSRDGLGSPSSVRTANGNGHNSSSYLPPPLHTSYHFAPSHTGGSSSTGSLATSVAGRLGKKSMPDLRTGSGGHHHGLPRSPHGGAGGAVRGHSSSSASEEDSRSPSPVPAVPPMPTSISLSAHLAAYASGNGYGSASAASPLSSSPGGSGGAPAATNAASAAFTRRSYSNLRSIASSPARDHSATSASQQQQHYATIGHSFSSPARRREVPSVQGLFQAHGIPDRDSAPPTPSREQNGGAGAVRQPSGAGAEVGDWRRRG